MAGIALTDPRRSELLSRLLQQQEQQPNIQSTPELGLKLLAQALRQKQVNALQGEEKQAQSQSNRRIADVLAGDQGRQLLDLEGLEGTETLSIPQKRGAEGAARQSTKLAGLSPQELQAAQTLSAGQRAMNAQAH